jgi:hypothetical protein
MKISHMAPCKSFWRYLFSNADVYKSCRHKICGGSAPTPPAETVVSALCVRILRNLIRVFASLFAKSEWVSGQRPETPKKRKKVFCTFSTDERFQKGNKEKK